MLELGNMPPKPEGGHLLVVVARRQPTGRHFGPKHYLCLRCLRITKRYPLFYERMCTPSNGRGYARGYLDTDSQDMTREIADLIAEERLENGRGCVVVSPVQASDLRD